MSQEDQKKQEASRPEPVEGDIIDADYDEEAEDDEDGYEAYEDGEEEGEYEDDEEYYEAEEGEEEDYRLQARNLADALNSSGLLSQVSAMMGGGMPGGEATFMRGRAFQASGELEEAAEAFLDVIEQNPEHLRAYVALGQVLLAMDKPQEAITFLEKATELDPYDAGSYFFLGYAYYALQDFEKCVEYFGKVVELDPTHHLAFNNLGFSQYLTGDLEGAAQSFIKAGDVGSDRAYYNLGMIRLIQGKEKEGWQAYQDAFELDPHGNQLAEHLSDLQTAQERFPEAAPLLAESEERIRERADELGVDLDEEEYDEDYEEEDEEEE